MTRQPLRAPLASAVGTREQPDTASNTRRQYRRARPAVSRATNPGPDTTHSVAIYDVSVDFASDRYDANSAAGYDANLDANSYRALVAWLATVTRRLSTKIIQRAAQS